MNNNYNFYNPYSNFVRTNPTNYVRSYNPYLENSIPNTRASGGILGRLLGGTNTIGSVAAAGETGFSFTNFLNGASKTLGVINQAIPVFYQVKPIWNNAKTMFRVAKAMNSNETTTNNNSNNNTNNNSNNNNNNINNTNNNNSNEPTFFQ